MPTAQLQQQRLVGTAAGRPRAVGSTLPRTLLSSLSAPPTSSASRTYTTAGTVYNPETAAPIQPPARRGRIDRWHQNQPRNTLSPRSILNSQHPNLTVWRAPRTATSRLETYAPLQQNNDRAVTPPLKDKDKDSREPFRGMKAAAASLAPRLEGMTSPGPDVGGRSLDEHPDNVVQPRVEGGGEEHEDPEFAAAVDALASQFNAKGLTNLASYKNPSQKAAQRALARARPSSSAAPASSKSEALGKSQSEKTDTMAYRGAYQMPFHGAHQTCVPGYNALGSNGCNAGFPRSSGDSYALMDGTYRHDVHGRMPFRGAGSFVPANNMMPTNNMFPTNHMMSTNNMTYPCASSLATGPGAPPPLTAGPPGLRRHQPSSLRHTSSLGHPSTLGHLPSFRHSSSSGQPWSFGHPSSLGPVYRGFSDASTSAGWSTEYSDSGWESEQAQKEEDEEDDGDGYPKRLQRMIYDVIDSSPPPKQPPIAPPSKQPQPSAKLEKVGDSPEKVAESRARARAAFEATSTPSCHRHYYPYGFQPANNRNQITSRESLDEPLGPPIRINGQRTPEELERHRRKVDESWYSGVKNIHKSVDDVVRENTKRQMFRAVGRFKLANAMNMPNARLEKTETRLMTIEEANEMDVAEHAAPLLNMAFATILSHAEEGGFCRRRTGWVAPDPRIIDNSEAGLRSFFAS